MDFAKRIKELNRRIYFSGPRSVLDKTGLIQDEPQETVLDKTGLVEDDPFKPGPIDNSPTFYHEA